MAISTRQVKNKRDSNGILTGRPGTVYDVNIKYIAPDGKKKTYAKKGFATKKEAAQRCGLTEKYYSDIERGSCGMSVETLISLSELYGFTTDYLLHGEKEEGISPGIRELFLANLGRLSPERQNYCLQMLFLFIEGTSVENGSAEAE